MNAHLAVVSAQAHLREQLAAAASAAGVPAQKLSSIESLLTLAGRAKVAVIDLTGLDRSTLSRIAEFQVRSPGCTCIGLVSNPNRRLVLDLAKLGFQSLIVQGPLLTETFLNKLSRISPDAASADVPAALQVEPSESAPAIPQTNIVVSISELKRCKPIIGRAELIQLVDRGAEMRAMRPVVQRVMSALASPTCSVEDVARTVKQDHALSIKVMRLANSALFSRGDKVQTIAEAVKRVGLSQLRQCIMSMGVVEQFDRAYLDGRVSSADCWEHSLGVALIASRIGALRGGEPEAVDALFTAGLLHDVGRMILFDEAPELMRHVVQTADALGLPWEVVESRLLLLNHAEVTDRVLRSWKFPPHLTNLIANHHLEVQEIRERCPREFEDIATLALADRLAHIARIGHSGNDTIYPIEEFCASLSLGDTAVAQVTENIHEQTEELRLCMLASSTSTESSPSPQPPLEAGALRAHLLEDPAEVAWLGTAWKSLGGLPADADTTLAIARCSRRFGPREIVARVDRHPVRHIMLLVPPDLKADLTPLDAFRVICVEEPLPVATLVRTVLQVANLSQTAPLRAA